MNVELVDAYLNTLSNDALHELLQNTDCTFWVNEALAPDFQIRFCIASAYADSLAFIPLRCGDWDQLESRHNRLDEHFAIVQPFPNLFTDGFGKKDWRKLALDPGTKLQAVKAHRDQHGCTLSKAKYEVDQFIFLSISQSNRSLLYCPLSLPRFHGNSRKYAQWNLEAVRCQHRRPSLWSFVSVAARS